MPAPTPQPASQPSPRVVRSSNVQPLYPVARLIKGAVLEAEQQRMKARDLLQQVTSEATRIVDEARAQAKAVLEEARQQGTREGVELFRDLMSRAAGEMDLFTQKFSEEVTRIAFRIAREVLDVEFAAQPQRIVELVKSAMHHLRNRFPQRIVVHLNPMDYAIVVAASADFAGAVSPDTQFSLVQDPDLQRRQVVLETEMGHYDFGVESQLSQIANVLKT